MQKKNRNKFQKIKLFIGQIMFHVPFAQKIFFIEHLRTMIHAGLSLVESLDVLSKEIENKRFRSVIAEIKTGIEKGQTLNEVLAKYPKVFPPIYVKMVAAGEVAGRLEESLQQIVLQMQKSNELSSSIHSAMIYPSVIIAAMIGIGIMMTTVVLPKLTTMFDEFKTELPLATRILIKISNFSNNPINLAITIIGLGAIIASFMWGIKKNSAFRRKIHSLNLHLPIFGRVIKKINLARFSLTLSSLLKSTIPIINATNITADTCSNVKYCEALREAAEQLKSGKQLSEILSRYPDLFSPMVIEMILVGERTGEIEQLLNELAEFYSKEVDKTMKNFTTIIEPVIIIFLGIAVAGLAVAVIMPMYTLIQNF